MRLQDAPQRSAPPKPYRYQRTRYRRDEESRESFHQRDRRVFEQRAVLHEFGEGLRYARRRRRDERVYRARRGKQFPQSYHDYEHADPAGIDGDYVSVIPDKDNNNLAAYVFIQG